MLVLKSLKFARDPGQFREERLNEMKELRARLCENEGTSLKKGQIEFFLEFEQLRTHRWLLDSEGHLANRWGDPLVLGHVVEELKVVDVHLG